MDTEGIMMARSSGFGRCGFLHRLAEKGVPMQSSGRMRAQITTLIIATSLIQLANGFFGTFISLRVAIEDFGPTMAGLVLSSYFAGFTLAAVYCGRIMEQIGHIRGYAAFAGLVVAATAAMPLMVGSRACLVRARLSRSGAPDCSLPPKVGSTPRPNRRSAGGSSRST